jgi:hypothetical protein
MPKELLMPISVSAECVRARWAYSELLSPSFGYFYRDVARLKGKAIQRVPFEELTAEDIAALACRFDNVRGQYFNAYFVGVRQFELTRWSKDQLAAVYVIPYFTKESEFGIAMTFKQWTEASPGRTLEMSDPRRELSNPVVFKQEHPITVGRDEAGKNFLLDGYHRACRFWGIPRTTRTLAAFVPS